MATRAGSRVIVPAAFWLGLAAAVLALWLSGQAGDAWDVVRAAWLLPLLLVVAIGMALPVVHALRWALVMRALGTGVPLPLAADLTVSASLVNYAGPGYLGAPAKAFLANRAIAAPWSRSLLSMAFEQGLDFLVLLAGSAVAITLLGPEGLAGLVPHTSRAEQVAMLALLVVLALLIALGWRQARRGTDRVVAAFRALGGRVDRGPVGALTIAYWLAQAAVVWLLLLALHLPADAVTVLSLSTIPLLVGQLAPLPGGVGAREAAIVALSGATGASASELLGLAVLQRVLLVAALPLSLGLLRLARAAGIGGAP
jgi:uncharacterized membrane protein YbhN (UPF0104 family)